jgi:streptomycin 6-kinase
MAGADDITIPDSFLAMPRWWTDGAAWPADLPGLVRSTCHRWGLHITGDVVHGSNTLVVPVVQDGIDLVLRLSPPGEEVDRHAVALRFWDGRGTVLLVEADPAAGALLLERLDRPSLRERPVDEAMHVLGQAMRRLGLSAPADALSTADRCRARTDQLKGDWRRLNAPFDAAFLTEALRVADALAYTDSDLAVDGELHSEQVLHGRREDWTVVDPVLLRGDIDYDLGRIIWTRVDEMPDAAAIVEHFDTVVREAAIERDRARDWVVFRTVGYWLWGLRRGLSEDPERCHRLATVFTA